jgi:hypothetical protein
MGGARCVEHMVNLRNACRILVGKPKGKTAFGTSRRRSEDNIKMDIREIV